MQLLNKILIFFMSVVSLGTPAFGQGDTSKVKISDAAIISENYEKAFSTISEMLEKNKTLSFKNAVFATENAYLNNTISYHKFVNKIDVAKTLIGKQIQKTHLLNYKEKDSLNFKINGLIYNIFRDTLAYYWDSTIHIKLPLNYDFNDYLGKKAWENTFVLKLLVNNTGNCRSLPYLYKIIADEMGAKCWLSLAPQHIYIKNYSKQYGWYNTELTSKEFPTEGWMMASGYITLEAIQNGIFMDTIGTKQAVAFCLIDLANGYNRKLKSNNGEFVLKCCDLSLKYFPTNINAMLLKAETLKQIYLKNKEIEKHIYQEMLDLYLKIHNLGYREMPNEMYIEWMKTLQTQKDKFVNKNISNAFKKPIK